MKKKIVIMVARSLSYRDFLRFGVRELSDKFDIRILDFSELLNKKIFPDDPLLPRIKINKITKFSDLITLVKNNNIFICFDYLPNGMYPLIIRRIFNYQGAMNLRSCLGPLPQVSNSNSIAFRIKRKIKIGNVISNGLNSIIVRLSKKLEPTADFLVASGKKCINEDRLLNYKKIIWAHSFDYQNYFEFSKYKQNIQKNKNYIVFLDQMAPTHPDYKFHNIKPPTTEVTYYESMNRFFDHLEKETNMSVIVAEHPRRCSTENDWSGRKTIRHDTLALVVNSSLVISHYSSSISYAVLSKKPIMLVTTNEYFKSYRQERFIAFGKALNKKVINVDNYVDNVITNAKIFSVDLNMYKKYIELYLKVELSAHKNLWDIVIENINNR